MIPSGKNLLEIEVASFRKKEVEQILITSTRMPVERAKQIAETVKQKLEFLKLFQEGKKIWKLEKYW